MWVSSTISSVDPPGPRVDERHGGIVHGHLLQSRHVDARVMKPGLSAAQVFEHLQVHDVRIKVCHLEPAAQNADNPGSFCFAEEGEQMHHEQHPLVILQALGDLQALVRLGALAKRRVSRAEKQQVDAGFFASDEVTYSLCLGEERDLAIGPDHFCLWVDSVQFLDESLYTLCRALASDEVESHAHARGNQGAYRGLSDA